MFHEEAIDAKTLGLLKDLQASPEFSNLYLVGGTGLALQIGHRKSIDIDLFGEITADSFAISQRLSEIGQTMIISESQNIHVYTVSGIKVDIVNYPYAWLDSATQTEGIRLAGKRDIAAMKLAAITSRGAKKDFVDLYFLLKEFTLSEMLQWYADKYPDGSEFLVLRSLSYFDDAEQDEDPLMLVDWSWSNVKDTIRQSLRNYSQ